jgi:hypothetical protein
MATSDVPEYNRGGEIAPILQGVPHMAEEFQQRIEKIEKEMGRATTLSFAAGGTLTGVVLVGIGVLVGHWVWPRKEVSASYPIPR